ncbi:tudor domain-containing protein 3-like isoform X2 [Lycorma delicatula]|uniref:tudor domain-containing protein 3-like isoform X2 n=1 Tax=Lycorma delicatula TaxID=130591 RepID=UPI003F51572E
MDTVQFLKEDGWYLSNDGVNKVSENGSIKNVKTIISKALNFDIREIGASCFPEDIAKGKLECISGNIIVQIQKVRNVSAPKSNEESHGAPRMLKIALTDGHTVCQAIELEPITSLSLNTPPGTKIFLKGEILSLSNGMLLLQDSTTQVLGGVVPQLIEKWELHRSLAKHTRGRVGEEGGPPPWIPFGQKIVRPNIQDRNFKSLDDGRDNKENAEFEAQRKDAIAEAARGGAKKVFGGGNARSLIDKNVKQIVEVGFTLDQAEQALQQARNNVNKALRILQKKEVASGGGNSGGGGTGGGSGRGGRRRGGDREEDGGGPGSGPKPSGKVSLFDYLEDKLPTQNEKETELHDNSHTANSHHHYSSNSNSTQKSTFNSSSHGHRGGSRQDSSGNKSRGAQNTGSESRHSRDDRNQNQKPPRFQNQQRYQESNSYQNWSYNNSSNNEFSGYDTSSVSVPMRGSYMNSRVGRNSHDEGNYNENFNRSRHQSNHTSYTTNDYSRSNRRYENSGYYPPAGFNSSSQAQHPVHQHPSTVTSHPPSSAQYTAGGGKGILSGEHNSTWQWKVGDKCMAKYWEDNMYYNAEVTGLSKKTCVVRFLEYGNFEEVLQDDCIPIAERITRAIENSKF